MPYLPIGLPQVTPTLDDREFWARCNERRLHFQCCADCNRFRHPPLPICAACHSDRVTWCPAVGPTQVFSFTWVHHPAHPAVASACPYNVALIAFPGCGGVRLISNVIDARPETLVVGAAVILHWDQDGHGQWLPRFRMSSSPAATRL